MSISSDIRAWLFISSFTLAGKSGHEFCHNICWTSTIGDKCTDSRIFQDKPFFPPLHPRLFWDLLALLRVRITGLNHQVKKTKYNPCKTKTKKYLTTWRSSVQDLFWTKWSTVDTPCLRAHLVLAPAGDSQRGCRCWIRQLPWRGAECSPGPRRWTGPVCPCRWPRPCPGPASSGGAFAGVPDAL